MPWTPTCILTPVCSMVATTLLGLLRGLSHRLFAIDVLARLGRIDGHLCVPVLRRRDQHVVDVLGSSSLR